MSNDSPDVLQQFLDAMQSSVRDRTFRRLVLAKPVSGHDVRKVAIREVIIKGAPSLSVLSSYATNDITKNYGPDTLTAVVEPLIGPAFLRAHLTTATEQIDLSFSKKGNAALHRVRTENTVTDSERTDWNHDRKKQRFIPQDRPYLSEVGITDRRGQIVPAMARKWKQINKFVEIIDGAISSSTLAHEPTIRAADFGSGKGYLTFALHDHLVHTMDRRAEVVGVEIRRDLVDASNLAASRAHADDLRFVTGEVASFDDDSQRLDLLVALHACDIATDIAIHRGILSGAQIIVCSPCCHKELRPQIQAPPALKTMLGHGVHLGLEADMVTDTIRALLLEEQGYDTKIFEFVGLEDTSKNKMILAVKRAKSSPDRIANATSEREGLQSFYGITSQHLAALLGQHS